MNNTYKAKVELLRKELVISNLVLVLCAMGVIGVSGKLTTKLYESEDMEFKSISISDKLIDTSLEERLAPIDKDKIINVVSVETNDDIAVTVMAPYDETITVPSIKAYKTTREIVIKPDKIINDYLIHPEMNFGPSSKHGLINVLWNFLVHDNGYDEKLAAGIIGNILCEGDFGEIQGGSYLDSLEEASKKIPNSKNTGYGIAQWTSSNRKNLLNKYYHKVNELLSQRDLVWEEIRVIAECCCLLTELEIYNIPERFNNLSDSKKIQSATGLIALEFEAYDNCEYEWTRSSNRYILKAGAGYTGYTRYEYAQEVYNFYCE